MLYTVSISQEHISKGYRQQACNCPAALAIQEQTPFKSPLVTDKALYLGNGTNRLHNSHELCSFVRAFDRGDRVFPITFSFEA